MNHTLKDAAPFVQHAVRKLAALWNSTTYNNSGMRATFRRWNPGDPPSLEMQRYVWELVFQDNENLLAAWSPGEVVSDDLAGLVERTAIIVALRAASGEPEVPTRDDGSGEAASAATGEPAETETGDGTRKKRNRTLGHALHDAELSDLRMMRLLKTPHELRLRDLHRAMRYLARKHARLDWSLEETQRFLHFLFGTEGQAELSIDRWAQDFLSARAKSLSTEAPAESVTA